MKRLMTIGLAAAGLCAATPSQAALTTFQSFTGNIGLSTSGCGSTTQSCSLFADAPSGSTVVGAWLYTSTFNASLAGINDSTLDGNAVTFTGLGVNTGSPTLQAARADVTSIVAPIINGGAGGHYTFQMSEGSGNQDGEALVVVFKNAALGTTSIGILDGFAATTGDNTKINFSDPLDPTAAGFIAEMRLGIGFSFDGSGCNSSGQSSQVKVNGTLITNNAGCNDDSIDATASNGNLITVGDNADPCQTALLPTIHDDHERYCIANEITKGDTSISVDTINASNDDNIFLAAFQVTGNAGFNAPPPPPVTGVPEPATLAVLGLGLAGLGLVRRRR